MVISGYRNSIYRNLDILESATRNAQILSYISELRSDVDSLYECARNYQDALSYVNGITQSAMDDSKDEVLEPDVFNEVFFDVPVNDDLDSIFYDADAIDEGIRRGAILKNSDGSLSSADESENGKLSERLDLNEYYVSDEEIEALMVALNESFSDELTDTVYFKDSGRNIMEFLEDDDSSEVPDTVFESPLQSDKFLSYDEIKNLLQTSPDRLAFLRSSRSPSVSVPNDPIEITDEEIQEDREREIQVNSEFINDGNISDLSDDDDIFVDLDEEDDESVDYEEYGISDEEFEAYTKSYQY